MTVKECYEKMGGDYADAMSRLRDDDRIKRFLGKVASDKSFDELSAALSAHDVETAFRAAHTLKGVSSNLSITALYRSASALTEALRGKTEYDAEYDRLFDDVARDHALAVRCINGID